MNGNSENNLDPFYPNPASQSADLQYQSDSCLGNVNAHTPFYHYYSFSPCMLPSPQQ